MLFFAFFKKKKILNPILRWSILSLITFTKRFFNKFSEFNPYMLALMYTRDVNKAECPE